MLKKILAILAMLYAAASFAAVDVNKANAADLDSIKGIGPVMSQRILDERKKGDFKSWDDLITRVKGETYKKAADAKKDDKKAAKDEKKEAKAEAKADKKDAKADAKADKKEAKAEAKADKEAKPQAKAETKDDKTAAAKPAASAAKPAASGAKK